MIFLSILWVSYRQWIEISKKLAKNHEVFVADLHRFLLRCNYQNISSVAHPLRRSLVTKNSVLIVTYLCFRVQCIAFCINAQGSNFTLRGSFSLIKGSKSIWSLFCIHRNLLYSRVRNRHSPFWINVPPKTINKVPWISIASHKMTHNLLFLYIHSENINIERKTIKRIKKSKKI